MQTFSIVIPTWNNLAYLQNVLRSLELHSRVKHQVIVVVNEGVDGTTEWLDAEQIPYVHHRENVGVCVALNSATEHVKHDYLLYLNDDMYVLPGWDTALAEEINMVGHQRFMLSGTMIEPEFTGNACVQVQDFGDNLDDFDEAGLLRFHGESEVPQNWSGASWPPLLVPFTLWREVGGMSEEFSPGMYSDPDLSMKFWQAGVRYFKGVGRARVYHFGSKSTRRLGKNIGRQTFLNKWGVTPGFFYRRYLKMGERWCEPQKNFSPSAGRTLIHWCKRTFF
ncbi:glycosyltransferase family 2 protein [Gilvimarinus xylanilyticus]|uniref:Glycosyltransferase n=1 Tax=Gilvimarinus xylanilyticus TaxID=2944139 RepID=A0A9X2HZP6_9GAMM|nr:glycosyltransferase [Gilvimarinus xylanilyticus]